MGRFNDISPNRYILSTLYSEVTFGTKKKWPSKTFIKKRGSIYMKYSMTEQEKGGLLIEVTA